MEKLIKLPPVQTSGGLSLNEAIAQRRSERSFSDKEVSTAQISQILWAAQGVDATSGLRNAPSAGATFPLEIYTIQESGVFNYNPQHHLLRQTGSGDFRKALFEAALRQEMVLDAPLTVLIAAEYERTVRRYGPERTPRYVHMEVGHAAQNVLLQCVSLGLGAVPIGAFNDRNLRRSLHLPEAHKPLYLIPIGHVRP